jgi:UDP-GlcNAc3NAcA epimerase
MIRIATVVGARPQFIKAAIVSQALRREGHEEILIHTGQHFDTNMSDVFFSELDMDQPRYNLGIAGGLHGQQTGRMLEAIEKVLLAERPDWVLIYGDTNSTIAAALAAAKLHIPIAHVEAGLRSFNRRMPEEINRVVADSLSHLLFTPTSDAVRNLEHEGIDAGKIVPVGDVMYDASQYFGAKAERQSDILAKLQLEPGNYILATVHRAENTDDEERLRAIFDGLSRTSTIHPVVWPLHPRTRDALRGAGLPVTSEGTTIQFTDPLGYLDMLLLERSAQTIITDSGGVQKEAYFHKVPCVTLRDETEWVELVEHGWNVLCPPVSAEGIVATVEAVHTPDDWRSDLYGDGRAADRIAGALSTRTSGMLNAGD